MKFKQYIDMNMLERTFNKGSKKIVNELKIYGINKLSDIDKIIGKDINKFVYEKTNYIGLLRDIMMINDINLYFEKAWKRSWTGIDRKQVDYYSSLGIDMETILNKHDLEIDEEENNYDEDFYFEEDHFYAEDDVC